MTSSRVVVLTGSAALLAAWLSSAAGTAPMDGSTRVGEALAQSVTPTPVRLDFEREVARLSARLERAPRPRDPGRNPFTLVPRPHSTRAGPSAPVTMPEPAAAAVVRPVAPVSVMSLAGIATERTSYGRRHTAILTTDGRVFLAGIGDEVMGRFQVRAVTDDSVELLDLRDGTPLHLALP